MAFVTGAARGQGRAHAVRPASEGADVIAVDLCDQFASVLYPMAARDDLAATVKLVEETGARIIAKEADVRSRASLTEALQAGLDEFGRLDIGGAIGYAAAKHGVVGLMRVYANVLARHNIRVNSIHPSAVRTPMIDKRVHPEMGGRPPSRPRQRITGADGRTRGHRQRGGLAGVRRRPLRQRRDPAGRRRLRGQTLTAADTKRAFTTPFI